MSTLANIPEAALEKATGKLEAFFWKHAAEYDEAHMILARHAAFPAVMTVDLLYQLWANFKDYDGLSGRAQVVPMLAVSDVLVSGLFRQTGRMYYEMDAPVRAVLLDELKDDDRFGELRMGKLARFLLQYTDAQPQTPENEQYHQVQRWTAWMSIDPHYATQNLLQTLVQKVKDNQVNQSIGVTNLLESFLAQQPVEENSQLLPASDAPAQSTTSLGSFDTRTIVIARGDGAGAQIDVQMPAFMASRLQQVATQYAPKTPPGNGGAGKLFAVVVGIDAYHQKGMELYESVNDAAKFSYALGRRMVAEQVKLENEQATKEAVLGALADSLEAAQNDDTVLFYFAGHANNNEANSSMLFYDLHTSGSAYKEGSGETGVLFDKEFNAFIKTHAKNDPYVVLIMDTHSGSRVWLDELNPKHFSLMTTHLNEITYEWKGKGGLFTRILSDVLENAGPSRTYKELYRLVMEGFLENDPQQNEISTPLFVVHETSWNKRFPLGQEQYAGWRRRQQLQQLGYNAEEDRNGEVVIENQLKAFREKYKLNEDDDLDAALRNALSVGDAEWVQASALLKTTSPSTFYVDKLAKTLSDQRVSTNFIQIKAPAETR